MLLSTLAGFAIGRLAKPQPKVALPDDLTVPPYHELPLPTKRLAVQCVALTEEVFDTTTEFPLYNPGA